MSPVQVWFSAYFKTSHCAGFSCFHPSFVLCPIGISDQDIQVNCCTFGDKAKIKSKGVLSIFAPMSRATAGTPSIRNSNGSLQIIFNPRDGGKRKCLSLGLHDSKQNRIFVELAAKRTQNDILAGHFKGDLSIYKPQSSFKAEEHIPVDNLSIRNLWDSYTNYKRPQLSQTTIAADYERISIYIDKFPSESFSDAVVIRD